MGKARWAYPLASEADLLRVIQRALRPITTAYHKALLKDLGDLSLKKDSVAPGVFLDAEPWKGSIRWGTAMRLLLGRQYDLYEVGEGKQGLLSAVLRVGKGLNTFNNKQFEELTSLAIGNAFSQSDPWVPDTLTQWATENYSLITSLSSRYIGKVNTIVQTATDEGWTARKVMQKLRDADRTMTVSKAKLIARDQVGKLNGQLTRGRMKTAGISMYRWSTSMDERVRGNPAGKYSDAVPSHWLMQGKICRWDDNNVWSTDGVNWSPRDWMAPRAIPGEEIQCRCTAIPYFGKAIEDLVPGMQETVL